MKTIFYRDIEKALQKWPFLKGSALMVHSSLSSFGGWIEGGPSRLIDALCDAVGPSGTLIMPTLSFSSVDEKRPYYDAANSPSDCGTLTEVFRRRKDVCRSLHVVSSAAAWGKNAREFTAQHWDTPCGPQTPYGQLIQKKGYVLFLGVTMECNTLFHAAEEAVSPSYLSYATIADAHIIDADGKQYIHNFRRYNCYQTGVMRYLNKMEPVFEKAGVFKRQWVGSSQWTLIAAKDDFDLCSHVLKDQVSYILEP